MFSESQWIWPDSHNWDIHNSYALFRKSFPLATLPPRAPLFITADQSYQLYVNGEYVCRGPARGFQHHWPYDEVDVRPHLRKGRNVIAVRAHNPGFSNFQYLTNGYAGLLVSARWGPTRLVSDQSWKCRRQTGLNRDTVPTSLQLFCQEHIDLREEDPTWMKPSFDDSGWTAQPATAAWNAMPWYSLEARGIPLLEEIIAAPYLCIGTSQGRSAKGYALTRDAARLRHAEGLRHIPCNTAAEKIKVAATGRGRFRSYLIDFGKTVVGSMGFEILGAKGGEILDTLHFETMDEATCTPHYVPDKHCRMAFAHRLVCRTGDQSHTFYHTFGFRYLVLTARDSTAPLTVLPHFRSTLYPMVQNGTFLSSEATLQGIWDTCAWTQRICSIDAYVDTPWREQAQWWGDARVQAKNTFFYSGDTRLFRRGIAQIASQTAPNGLTYGHAPTMAHSCILPDFTLIWMITLWDYYWQTGSIEPFQTHQKTIEAALQYFEKLTDPKTQLVGQDQRYWLFLDWTGLFKDGYSTVYNLWLLIALDRLTALAKKANNLHQSKRLTTWAAKVRKALVPLERKDGLLSDGLTFRGKRSKETSIHAQTLAIIACLDPARDATRIEKVLLPFIRQETNPAISPSCYWITYVFEVLTAAGHGAEVLAFIKDKWSPMTTHGTTWETFQPREADESFSHAWSAHPLYHLMQTVGGIRQIDAHWTKIIYAPLIEGDFNETVVPTPHGPIHSSWVRRDSQIDIVLSLPKGVTAQVHLPNRKSATVRGKSSWTIRQPKSVK
ncbi:hypothetical protein BH09VER1_BH09VER1_39130 [soil metagenome]